VEEMMLVRIEQTHVDHGSIIESHGRKREHGWGRDFHFKERPVVSVEDSASGNE
jgi:hypothetical protein